MNTIGWQHAKVKSAKRNPPKNPSQSAMMEKGYTFKI
jgi:hypothetical protein